MNPTTWIHHIRKTGPERYSGILLPSNELDGHGRRKPSIDRRARTTGRGLGFWPSVCGRPVGCGAHRPHRSSTHSDFGRDGRKNRKECHWRPESTASFPNWRLELALSYRRQRGVQSGGRRGIHQYWPRTRCPDLWKRWRGHGRRVLRGKRRLAGSFGLRRIEVRHTGWGEW